jgi:hypothetical protein
MNLYFQSLIETKKKRENMVRKQMKDYICYFLPNGMKQGPLAHPLILYFFRNGRKMHIYCLNSYVFPKINFKIICKYNKTNEKMYPVILAFDEKEIFIHIQIDDEYKIPPAFLLEPHIPDIRGKNYFLRWFSR